MLARYTRLISALPGTTLLAAGILALVSLAAASSHLQLKTSRLDLLNPDSDYNRRWLRYIAEFGNLDDTVVVVRGGDTMAVERAATGVAAHFQGTAELVRDVLPSRSFPDAHTDLRQWVALVAMRLTEPPDAVAGNAAAIDQVRLQLDSLAAQYPDVRLGLTGLPVIEDDEMRLSTTSTVQAGALSLLGVTGLFAVALGGLRHALLGVLSLTIGLAWTMGYITWMVGHLNLLSMAFGAILIGLGIDFAIHYLSHYLDCRPRCRDAQTAAIQTAAAVGPGILTGAATTSCAFFAAGLTHFTGVAELGIIAGGGILLCAVATLTVLPCLIVLLEPGWAARLPVPVPMSPWLTPLLRQPHALLGTSVLVTVGLVAALPRLEYDHNLLNLLPPELESVALERELAASSDRSVWFAVSMCRSREQLQARKAMFEQRPSIERTEDVLTAMGNQGSVEIPAPIKARFIGRNGWLALRVYGRGELWDMDDLSRFVTDVREVDREATGKPIQTYEASREMQRSYWHAALYALIAIMILLILDYWAVLPALLALLPVIAAMGQTFGILAILQIPLNPANTIVLPLILGIGIDDGVHVMHDYLRQPQGRYRLSNTTASAIVLTSLTTMVGFGSLMVSEHLGLASLGRVLVIGVSCCLFTSLCLLPAILTLIPWRLPATARAPGRAVVADEGRFGGSPSRPRPKLVSCSGVSKTE